MGLRRWFRWQPCSHQSPTAQAVGPGFLGRAPCASRRSAAGRGPLGAAKIRCGSCFQRSDRGPVSNRTADHGLAPTALLGAMFPSEPNSASCGSGFSRQGPVRQPAFPCGSGFQPDSRPWGLRPRLCWQPCSHQSPTAQAVGPGFLGEPPCASRGSGAGPGPLGAAPIRCGSCFQRSGVGPVSNRSADHGLAPTALLAAMLPSEPNSASRGPSRLPKMPPRGARSTPHRIGFVTYFSAARRRCAVSRSQSATDLGARR